MAPVVCLLSSGKKEMSFLYRISQPDQQHHEEVGVNPVCQLNDICKFFFFLMDTGMAIKLTIPTQMPWFICG